MNKLSLVIVDHDEIYLEYLNKFLSSTYKGKFEITCFSDDKIFLEYISTVRKKDILLISKDIYDENTDTIDAKVILKLVEGNEILEDKEKVIHKYKDIKNIYDIALKEYLGSNPKKTLKVSVENADTKIVTVYSPVGGSGKSLIAASLSSNLSQNGKKVFYLNLEDIQSTEEYFSGNGKSSLSDIIFEVKDKASNFIEKLNSIINTDTSTGVKYLNCTDNILDIEDMDQDDMKWLLEQLLKTKIYDYIVIDTVSKYNSVYDIVLNTSDIVITPILNNKTSINKVEKFIKNQSELDKYYFVQNMNNENSIMQVSALKYIDKQIDTSIYENKDLNNCSGEQAMNSPNIKSAINTIIEQIGL